MFEKVLADAGTGLRRSLCATRVVVLLSLRDQLGEQQGLSLSLIRCDILQNGRRFPILSDRDRALPLPGSGSD
jgi:hypothetical protein